MNRIQAEDILVRVSLDSRLQEGYQGVRLIMREILRGKNVPLHDISRATGIPVPAVSAARRELERRGRQNPSSLSPKKVNLASPVESLAGTR